jgi:hypothetical protein
LQNIPKISLKNLIRRELHRTGSSAGKIRGPPSPHQALIAANFLRQKFISVYFSPLMKFKFMALV